MEAVVSVGDRYVGQLPAFEADRPWWSDVEGTTRYLDELLGVPTFVLRLVSTDSPWTMRGGRVVFHVQAAGAPRSGVLDPTPRPDWPDIAKSHPLRATWAEVDGPQRLVDWAKSILGETGRPIQFKTWNLSCLIQLPTAGGGAWAKAASRFCSVDADVINHVHEYDAAWQKHVPGSDPSRALRPISVLIHLLGALTYQRFLDNIEPSERIYHEDDPMTELQASIRAFRSY